MWESRRDGYIRIYMGLSIREWWGHFAANLVWPWGRLIIDQAEADAEGIFVNT